MKPKKDQLRMTIDMDKTVHKKLKTLAAMEGRSMREVVVELIHDLLREPRFLNDETLRAIDEVAKRRNLTSAENADDLFEKLGV